MEHEAAFVESNHDGAVPEAAGWVAEGSAEWLELARLAPEAQTLCGMVVQSANMRRLARTVERLAPYNPTVLIQGESGTGKELVARALHLLGPEPRGPFVTFNCSNLLESLAESQLFGHVRGAFTDAREESLGYFRSANGGTLFLDEIGELPLKLQPKLLRAVETHEVQPVGSAQSYRVNIRLVAASNRDLRAMVKAGQFRDDLYYRLNATAVVIPPLRERRDGIDALAAHYVAHYNRLFDKHVRFISMRARDVLLAYDWPGNVRELAHAIQRVVMLAEGERIDLKEFPENLLEPAAAEYREEPVEPAGPEPLVAGANQHVRESREPNEPLLLDEVIRKTLLRSLEETEGNRRRAADLLGISRSTLYRMLSRYGVAENNRRRGGGSLSPATDG